MGILLTLLLLSATTPSTLVVDIEEGEHWWIGVVTHGHFLPFPDGYEADLNANAYGNQAQPLLVSSKGRYVWSEEAFTIRRSGNRFTMEKPSGVFILDRSGTTLKSAYMGASQRFFPATGTMPDAELFRRPQYNTWIELLYDQNQADILAYAKAIIDNGFPPGVIMIDDNWQQDYGVWEFRKERFPDAKAMIAELHAMGFTVMLWVCPFVSPDSQTYRELRDEGLLLKDGSGQPKAVHWWNGQSAVLDLTQSEAADWFIGRLAHLQTTYGVDGFKLDAGDPEYYVDVVSENPAAPNDHAELFARIGLSFPLNEYRATWKMGGQPLAQRLRDKGHSWEDLNMLVPHMVTAGLSGYAFTCPDMIGGGLMGSFINLAEVDQELMVRSTQTHALMPMMQFSVAPWRVLDPANLEATLAAVRQREQYLPVILELAAHAAKTGEPIVRHMEYEFPNSGFATVNDQFMLGSDILVAPVLRPGATTREVRLPRGRWKDGSGRTHNGGRTITVRVGIQDLPVFTRVR